MKVKEKLNGIILEIAKEKFEIDDNTILTTNLGFDSIGIINLIVEIEAQFNIEIDDDDLDMEILTTYSKLYDMIIRKIEKQSS